MLFKLGYWVLAKSGYQRRSLLLLLLSLSTDGGGSGGDDGGDDGDAGGDDATGGDDDGGKPGKTFTQADFDKFDMRNKRQAAARAEKVLLAELGVDSLDDLKASAEADKQRREADMSEAQKAKAEADKARAEAEQATATATRAATTSLLQTALLTPGADSNKEPGAKSERAARLTEIALGFVDASDEPDLPAKIVEAVGLARVEFPEWFGSALKTPVSPGPSGRPPGGQSVGDPKDAASAVLEYQKRQTSRFVPPGSQHGT